MVTFNDITNAAFYPLSQPSEAPVTPPEQADPKTVRLNHVLPKWKMGLMVLIPVLNAALFTGYGVLALLQQSAPTRESIVQLVVVFISLLLAVLPIRLASPQPSIRLVATYLLLLLQPLPIFRSLLHLPSLPLPLSIASPTALALLIILQLSLPAVNVPAELLDAAKGENNTFIESLSSAFEFLTFSYMNKLFKLGSNQTLGDDDVWNIDPRRRSTVLLNIFEKATSKIGSSTGKRHETSIAWRIFWLSRRDVFLDATYSITSICLGYAAPYYMKRILDLIEQPYPGSRTAALTLAVYAMLASGLKGLIYAHSRRHGTSGETRSRAMLMGAVYKKALLRKDFSGVIQPATTKTILEVPKKKKEKKSGGEGATGSDLGKIVSILSGDIVRITTRLSQLSDMYGPPIEVFISVCFLYRILGWSSFVGALVLVVSLPLNKWFQERAVAINKRMVVARDRRMTVMNELILSIKLIKFLGWERRWMDRAMTAREVELKAIIESRYNSVTAGFFYALSPVLTMLVSFLCYVKIANRELTVSVAFTSLQLFNMLKGPLSSLPAQFVMWAQAQVAVQRVEEFLQEPEISDHISAFNNPGHSGDGADDNDEVSIDGVFKWNQVDRTNATMEDEILTFQLGKISFKFPLEKMTIVAGPVGSGKSMLLLALLGEIDCIYGSARIPKPVGYCSQNPFLQQLSIRDNILYGAPFDAERYDMVLEACALKHDFRVLEDGDRTEIGVKGVVLSGGQKARLALARAVYSSAKTLLLDDPLAAVDVSTARHLYEQCLLGPLVQGRTIIIVSHHVDLLLPGAHSLIRLEDGRIAISGSVEELRASGALPALVEADTHEASTLPDTTEDTKTKAAGEPESGKKATVVEKQVKKLTIAEERSASNVSMKVYWMYIEASGLFIWVLVIALLAAQEGTSILSRFWLKIWGEAYLEGAHTLLGFHIPSATTSPMFYLGMYAIVNIVTLAVSVAQQSTSFLASYKAAKTLHDKLLLSVVRSTSRWFDQVPGGRVLNRFSSDVAALDQQLSGVLRTSLGYAASLLGALVLVVSVEPLFSIPAAILGFIYYKLSDIYARTSRDIRRMQATHRSPLFAGFGELLDGIVTVRAYASEARFLQTFQRDVDRLVGTVYWSWMTNRWLLIRFDFLGSFAVFLSMWLAISNGVSSGSSAMAILATQSFINSLYWLCRNLNQLELAFNAVERVEEYLVIPQEPPYEIEGHRPPAYWPSSSPDRPIIQVQDLELKYAPDLPTVVHGVSFEIFGGEKIALVGRTASGKSTLALSFLRFADPSKGKILIDGIDITSIGVQDLRSQLTYIPQEAVLFSGTLRENLDPFKQHTDDVLDDMLRRVHLTSSTPTLSRVASSAAIEGNETDSTSVTLVASSSSAAPLANKVEITLDTQISAGGLSLSQGQRQLVAMARALLRENNIVVMDEATSSIDHEMDALLQRTIREELRNTTVLCIAHRIQTIIDYSKVMVLKEGQIVEFDTPLNLLSKADGVFREMVEKTGQFNELKAQAEKGFGHLR